MTRLGFIGLRTSEEFLQSLDADLFYAAVGKNTGNLLFTRAVQKQLAADLQHVGFDFDPVQLRAEFDGLVIAAANWVSERDDFGFLADLIEQANIPCVIIGLGAQAGLDRSIPAVHEGTVRMLRAISERSDLISVRGAFTADVLAHSGIHDVNVTGCPSIYWHCRRDFQIDKPAKILGHDVAIHSTRYFVPGRDDPADVHQNLYRYALRSDSSIIYQSEIPELTLSVLGSDRIDGFDEDRLAHYYAADDWSALSDYLSKRSLTYLDVDAWISRMKAFDFVIGTRLHGTVASLLAGTPAMLIAHDSRTSEVAEFAGMPVATSLEVASIETRSRPCTRG